MNKEKLEELRIIAENHLNAAGGHIENLDRADLENIAHELAVYKVELEIQNEELRRTRISAEEARDRYIDLFENAPVGYFSLDEKNRIREVNRAGCLLFQTTKDNLLNKSFTQFILPEETDSFYLFRKKLMKNHTHFTYELQMQTKEGIPFFAQIESLNVGQEKLRLAVIDISARKKSERIQTLQKIEIETTNKELESFVYSVSHDLRTPLRTLDGFSEIVLMEYGDKLDETGKNYLTRIRKASQTIASFTEDLLKLSKITLAKLLVEKVNLSELACSIVAELQQTQPDRSVDFIIAPCMTVQGNKALLHILMQNLLENSWKYTGDRTDTRIEAGVLKHGKERTYFIKDNGIGFDMNYYDKLFEPFQRLHNDKQYPGTGNGLATAQRIIHRHGGRIWAESGPGKDTVFYFTLGESEENANA